MNEIRIFVNDYILLALSAFLVSATVTPLVRKVCRKWQIFDLPSSPRKIHTTPIPRLGGIAIYLAVFLSILGAFLVKSELSELLMRHSNAIISVFATSSLVFAVGVYDDIQGATVAQKLGVQMMAAIILYFLGFQIQLLSVPFVGSVPLGGLGLPITILWIVGVTNAINFIDGIDGLASGVGFFAASTMFILSLLLHHDFISFFAVTLAAGLLGFALYNFAPASIFMGDSGSLFVGFVISAIAIQSSQKSSTAVVLLIPIIILGVPIADTLLAIIRRLGHGRSPFSADREHIHHKLLDMGLSFRQVTFTLYGLCCVFGVVALLMTAVNNQLLTVLLVTVGVMTIGGLKMLGYTTDVLAINELARQRILRRKLLSRRQREAEQILIQVSMASDYHTLQKAVVQYCENMGFDVGKFTCSGIQLSAQTGQSGQSSPKVLQYHWYSPRLEDQKKSSRQIWTVTLPLFVEACQCGELQVGKYAEPESSFLDDTILIEYLKISIQDALMTFHPCRCPPQNNGRESLH